jgi:hypothetical protein
LGNLFQRSEEAPEMFKRLFFAVLGFWLFQWVW